MAVSGECFRGLSFKAGVSKVRVLLLLNALQLFGGDVSGFGEIGRHRLKG